MPSELIKLWIANTTKKTHVFAYRLLDRVDRDSGRRYYEQQAFMRPIKAGHQVCIENLTRGQADDIIARHGKYGVRPANEVSRQRGFVGLCWSDTDPVKMDTMLATFEVNDGALDAEAQKRREVTGAAISENIANELARQTGGDKERLRPQRVELQVVEDTDGKPNVASGVEVIAHPDTVKPRRAAGR